MICCCSVIEGSGEVKGTTGGSEIHDVDTDLFLYGMI
jgi:hypothetical protein